jgi:hypothetical protein
MLTFFRKQLELQAGQQKIWDEELAPTQAGEDTPECQTIVKRYNNNKVGRFQRRKRGVATNNN